MTTEAFSVAIKLKLIDGVTAGIIGLTSHFSALNKHVQGTQAGLTSIQKQLQAIRTLGMVGGGVLGAGIVGLDMLGAPLKAAREYELAFTKFKTLNLGDAVNQQADKFARSANLMGVSAKELMTTMSESVGLFGSFGEAQKLAPKIAQLNAANSAIFGGKIGSIDEGSTRALMKFIDRRGGTKDEASFMRNLDLAQRIVTGSGGFTQFRDLAQFSQQGGTAFRGLSDQGVLDYALLMQETGGARAGTALMSIYQNLVAGRTPVKTMAMLQQMGFGSISQVHNGSVGGKKSTSNTFQMKPEYAALLQADPMAFFRDVWLPQLASHGITGDSEVLKATNDLLSNRTASSQASIFTTQGLQAARDSNLAKSAMGYKQTVDQAGKDPSVRWMQMQKAYTNLMVELGETVLPIVTKAVTALTKFIIGLTAASREFPGVAKAMMVAFLGLSSLAVAGGSLTLIVAGFKALNLVLTGGLLGPALTSVAQGLGGLSLASKAGLVGATLAGSVGVGLWLNNKFGLSEKIGGFANTLINGSYDPNVGNITRTGPSGSGKPTVVNMHLDKQKIGSIMLDDQARRLAQPQNGGSLFDGSRSLLPAGGY